MLERIDRGDSWAIEHLSRIPWILKRGRMVYDKLGKVVYLSRRKFFHPDRNIYVPLQVVVKEHRERWYVETFYPVYY